MSRRSVRRVFAFYGQNIEGKQLCKRTDRSAVAALGEEYRTEYFAEHIRTEKTRGLRILVAPVTAKEHTGISLLCHNLAGEKIVQRERIENAREPTKNAISRSSAREKTLSPAPPHQKYSFDNPRSSTVF